MKGILFHQAADRIKPYIEDAARRADEAFADYLKHSAAEQALRAQSGAHYEAAYRFYRRPS